MQTEQDLPRLPFPVPDVTDIAPRYRALHAEQPINPVRTAAGDVAWLVTGYHEVKALLGDERLGRTHPDPDRAARISQSMLGAPMGNYETEQEDHQRLRRLLASAFSARRMQAMCQRVEEITGDLLDRLATLDRPADLHTELSYPLPVRVICELLGVPSGEHEKIRNWSASVNHVDAVVLAAAVANRDERAFADPDRFDITRQINQHVMFGHGRRFCLGASLARIELQVVFGALTKRFPTLRLAVPQEKLRLRGEAFTGGLTELPVTW
jgi:cytochrome P450